MMPISRNEKRAEKIDKQDRIIADAAVARDGVLVNYNGLIMRNRFHVIKWNELEHVTAREMLEDDIILYRSLALANFLSFSHESFILQI